MRIKKNAVGHAGTRKITTDQSELAAKQQSAVSDTAGGGSRTRVRQREGSGQEALPGIQPIGSAQQPESRTDEATPRVLSLTPVLESAVSKKQTGIRLTPGHLPLPKGGKSILSQIAWPNDAARRADFLKRFSIPRDMLSRTQFHELCEGASFEIWRQLERWGFSTLDIAQWLIIRYLVTTAEEERERVRSDAILDVRALGSALCHREFDNLEKRLRGPDRGHTTQSAERQCRAELFRNDARELRAKDSRKSKTALARQLSRRYKAREIKYGVSVATILRVAGDLLEKQGPAVSH